MSFHISFVAQSVYSARGMLHESYAPAAVKAMIEKALDGIALPAPAPSSQSKSDGQGTTSSAVAASGGAPRKPAFFGVLVEAWGHICDDGSNGVSEIQRFLVRPLLG